jgi:hypothetical protein
MGVWLPSHRIDLEAGGTLGRMGLFSGRLRRDRAETRLFGVRGGCARNGLLSACADYWSEVPLTVQHAYSARRHESSVIVEVVDVSISKGVVDVLNTSPRRPRQFHPPRRLPARNTARSVLSGRLAITDDSGPMRGKQRIQRARSDCRSRLYKCSIYVIMIQVPYHEGTQERFEATWR